MGRKNIPQTFDIGNADVYFGTEQRYLGLSKGDTQIKVEIEQAKLEGGFPKRTFATAKSAEVATCTLATSNLSMENLAFALGTAVQVVASGDTNVVDELIEFADKTTTFYLAKPVVKSVVVNNAPSSQQTQEDIADGTSGNTSGDFTLTYPITALSDIQSIVVDGVSYAKVAVGSATTTQDVLSVEVVTAAGATNGNMQFFKGNGTTADATDVEGLLSTVYTPVPTPLTVGTDYNVDPSNGGIIPKDTENYTVETDYFVNYTYTAATKTKIPFGGSATEVPSKYMKIVKKLANGKTRTYHAWKAKITNGLDLTQAESDFHELPLELEFISDDSKAEGEQLFLIEEETI